MRVASVCLVVSLFCAANVSADLIGHWRLDEGTGETAADASPSGTTGIITNADTGGLGPGGSVWVDDPQRGTVISFAGDANSAYVRVGDIPLMTLDNDFTWAFWANQDVDQTSSNDVIFGNRYAENGADFAPRQFIKFTPTKFEWHMNGNGDDNLDYEDIPSGEWIHHAVVKVGTSLTYYRNGVEHSSGSITQALGFPQPLFLGAINTSQAGENWRGLLSDVRIYGRALSASEVAALLVEPVQVPLISGWAFGLLATLLAGGGALALRRRRLATA